MYSNILVAVALLSTLLSLVQCSDSYNEKPSLVEERLLHYPLANVDFMRFKNQINIEKVESVRKAMLSPNYKEDDENPFKNSGYFTTNETLGTNYYYLFMEAENGDRNAPVILWLNGGPGCSSMEGAFEEKVSMYSIDSNLQLKKNPSSWNKKYNMLFIDNPVNTGFSYSVKNYYVHNMDEMAHHLYIALLQFFEKYSDYQSNDFYITGESYGGAYIPSIAYKIQQEGYKINLKGIGIGNGLTAPNIQLGHYADVNYANSVIDEAGRQTVELYGEQLRSAIANKNWRGAINAWGGALEVVENSGLNVYDARVFGSYDEVTITKFLNLPETQRLMHTTGHHWDMCDATVYQYLAEAIPQSNEYKVISLLNEGRIKVLLYNGNMDLILPTSGAQEWIYKMEWNGKEGLNAAKRQIWKVGNNVAGYATAYKTLVQLSVRNAGHMVPMDQSEASCDMIDRFLVQ